MKSSKLFSSLLFVLALALFSFSSCTKERGCTDSRALSYDSAAEEDDGSCTYSEVSFYSKWGSFNNIPISSIDVLVEGNFVGRISAVYPNGPTNCSAEGTVSYRFRSGDAVDWNAEVNLINGGVIFASGGVVSPSRSSECIKVNAAN